MLDLTTLTALAQAATPFCGCRMVVEVQTYATDSTEDIRSENRAGSNPRLAQCEFHRSCSPNVILALVTRVREAETKLSNLCKCANRYPGRPTREL